MGAKVEILIILYYGFLKIIVHFSKEILLNFLVQISKNHIRFLCNFLSAKQARKNILSGFNFFPTNGMKSLKK